MTAVGNALGEKVSPGFQARYLFYTRAGDHFWPHPDDPQYALQLLLCPALNIGAESESRRAFAEGYFLDKATIDWTLKHYCPDTLDPADPRLSPLRAADVSGQPPAHVHTAEFDPLLCEGRAYADRLERAGVDVRYTCHAGMIHHFYGMADAIPYGRVAIELIGADIKKALAHTDKTVG